MGGLHTSLHLFNRQVWVKINPLKKDLGELVGGGLSHRRKKIKVTFK